jgi:hypothetical protein
MKGDRIEIEDEWYLDTTAAAEKTGYTKDYVGQLARAGKIKARQLGRAWYVHEKSLLDHKKEVHHSNEDTAPVKTQKKVSQKKTRVVQSKIQKKDNSTSKKRVPIQKSNTASDMGGAFDDDDATSAVTVGNPTTNPSLQEKVLQEKVCTGVEERKNIVTTGNDPLVHTNISFHPDGPFEYQAGNAPSLPKLNKISDKRDVGRCSSAQVNNGVQKVPCTEHRINSTGVSMKKGGEKEISSAFFTWCVRAPYTVSVVVGFSVSSIVAFVSLL